MRFSLVLGGLLLTSAAHGAPQLRQSIDVTGDAVMIGNTLGQDCPAPAPVVGTVSSCTESFPDSSPTVFWRADDSSAVANPTVQAAAAQSTAVLTLPAGASAVRAYLYWLRGDVARVAPAFTGVIRRAQEGGCNTEGGSSE